MTQFKYLLLQQAFPDFSSRLKAEQGTLPLSQNLLVTEPDSEILIRKNQVFSASQEPLTTM